MKYNFKSPAKINLYLKILGVDPVSGLHFLETLMSPIDLFDEIFVELSEEFCVETKGIEENILTRNNIIFKIYKCVEKHIGKPLPSFKVTVNKNIPAGAGLGGGSSNGASFLLFLDSYCNLGLNKRQLVEIAAEVGSDIPFFLFRSPAMVTGTGNIVTPLKLPETDKHLLLVYPGIGVNTKLAYSLYDKKNLTNHRCMDINPVRKSGFCSLKNWTSQIVNDFEEVVFEHWTEINQIKLSLETAGADKVFMSGSGSTLIALFDDEKKINIIEKSFLSKQVLIKRIKLLTG